MKKIALILLCIVHCALCIEVVAQLDGKKVYINPGHGSWGPNDRPMATIPYPAIESNGGRPDTCGFYESNTNLWKTLELGRKLEAAGAVVMHSRTKNGPYPYVSGDETYNKPLSVICEEANAFEADYFISVHSNAASDGTTSNYPLVLYRGYDKGKGDNKVAGSRAMAETVWPYLFECMHSGLDPYSHYSKTSMNVRGDISFYGSSSDYGYLGALKHNIPGYLSEGYFHTYQPARHRALNPDYCKQEGIRYYRGVAAYFGEPAETKGYIMGTVKDLHEKMAHSLYNYAAKSNDQWVPCNGAVVTLYKGGEKVAEYNVDTLYNGIFYFPDLEPGNDYTLDATCEGYKPLFDEYKESLTVKANETTYPMIFLESTAFETPKEVLVDYPDKAGVADVAPSIIAMQQVAANTFAIEGTIKRTIQYNDSAIIILSHTEDKEAHLYLVNTIKNTISNISLEGIEPIDADNAGSYLALSDIALSCDGILVGCNYVRNQFDDNQVDAGYKRGTLQFYRWDSITAAPTKWVSTQNSGNFNRADVGMTFAINGEINDCGLTFTAVTSGSARGIRITRLAVVDNVIASTHYTLSDYTEIALGTPNLLQLSPLNTQQNYVFDGPLALPSEFELAQTDRGNSVKLAELATDAVNLPLNQTNYFRYAGHSFMVTPYYNADNLIAGVKVYDITEGLDKATLVVTNTELQTPIAATFAAATVNVTAKGFVFNLITDATITTFSSKSATEQSAIANIYAYALNVTKENDAYTFTFKANEDAVSAYIIFYQNEEEVGRQALTGVVKGENSVTINESDLPGAENTATNWAIELRGHNVTEWAKLYSETAVSYSRLFNTIDKSTESDYFGRIYAINRAGSLGNAANGLHVYSPEYVLENTTPYYSGQLGNPQRADVDQYGTLYLADWSDAHSGVYLVNPANVSGGMAPFFQGTAASNGLITNNGVEVASGTPGLDIFGKGIDAQLYVYCEDQGTTLPANSVYMYAIGNEDGTLKSTWGEAPSKVYSLKQSNGDGNIKCTSHGFFVSQNRSSGSNNAGVPALAFFDYEGNMLFNSGKEPYASIIDGSSRSAYAVTEDESRLIMQNGSNQFLVFDIVWEGNTPVLNFVYKYDHKLSTNVCQMNFDYAGNLVATGECGFHIFTIPTDNNTTTTPAKRSLVLSKGEIIPVEIAAPAPPVFNPEGHEYREKVEVSLSCETPNAVIYYTITEGETTSAEHRYTKPITLTTTASINAVTRLFDYNGGIVKDAEGNKLQTADTAHYLLRKVVEAPVITPAANEYSDSIEVSMICATANAAIYYTINGGAETLYVAPFTLKYQTATVDAYAVLVDAEGNRLQDSYGEEYRSENNTIVTYTHNLVVPAPKFSPNAGEYENEVVVTLSCERQNAIILYEIIPGDVILNYAASDEEVDLSDALYTEPITLTETSTVIAVAAATDAAGNVVKVNDVPFTSEQVYAQYIITKTDVGVNNVELAAVVYSTNGAIHVQAEAGTMIELFTVQGQCIYATEAIVNLTTIEVPTNIVLVRIAGQTVKVAIK